LPEKDSSGGFARLKEIISRLRGPGGCPWDRKQTHESLRPYLIEEAYEVLQTLEENAPQKLCEELGDLLLQIMLHAELASEAGQFNVEDVVRGISDKLVFRHPHVFGGREVKDAGEVEMNWESLKQAERPGGASLLFGVPGHMPALARSQLIQRRAAGAGFDWEKVDDILDKLDEEVAEVRQAGSQDEQAKEFGDLLFTLANIARRLGIDSEMALRAANERFSRRFSCMEQLCSERGVEFASLSLDEQNALWEKAKLKVKQENGRT